MCKTRVYEARVNKRYKCEKPKCVRDLGKRVLSIGPRDEENGVTEMAAGVLMLIVQELLLV